MIGHPLNLDLARRLVIVVGVCLVFTVAAATADPPGDEGESSSRFPDEPIPLQLDDFPERPKPLLELGSPFLGTGPLDPGFEMPGGAVLQPSVLVFGTYRTALQVFDGGDQQINEWVNRLDIFANIQLSGTERVLIGMRPLDHNGRFTGYQFGPGRENDPWVDEFNARLTTLFFEGDLGEMFPAADPTDVRATDWGFSIGRQPVVFQEGLLVNDDLDGVALVRDSIFPSGGSDLKLTFFYAWDNIHRNDNLEAHDAHMLAIFTESDFPSSTVQLDAVYVLDGDNGDGVYWGAGAVQRIGKLNTAVRVAGSYALDEENAAVSSGHLFFGEVSWTPHHTYDNMYVNAFLGIDQFASAARGPATGGPLGRTGILFAALGIGRYGAALGNRAEDAVGAALGYQWFSKDTRRQMIVEVGGRTGIKDDEDGVFAAGARYQQAIGQHTILQLDGFGGVREGGDGRYGARVELRFKF